MSRNGIESIANELDLTAHRLMSRLLDMADSTRNSEFQIAADYVKIARIHLRKMMSVEDREETS